MKQILTILFLIGFTISLLPQANISTSLHYTREGKNYAYKIENGGMETITGIPMSQLSCKNCHSTTGFYPNGNPIDPTNYAPSCNDCHNFSAGNTVEQQTCLNCHNRQVYERAAYPNMDAHQNANVECIDCHSKEELHGDDGIAYNSLKQPGAVKVECIDCHNNLPSNTSHSLHNATVDCAACHSVSILTCAGCHFESVVASGKNRAINQIKDYRLLVKKEGKIRLGGFMTHSYDGKTNYIISSYHSHIIKKDATTCGDCHNNMGTGNPAITEYNNTGQITMTTWNPTTKKVIGPSGVVPIPADWKSSLKMDYVTYTGDPTIFPSDPNLWVYLKSETDNSHMFYAEPLDSATLAKLGFTRFPTSVETIDNNIPSDFILSQNYPNPFNPSTKIEFSIPETSFITLKVYDAVGNEISTLFSGEKGAGNYRVDFDARNLASGIYFCKINTGNFSKSIKMLLMK